MDAEVSFNDFKGRTIKDCVHDMNLFLNDQGTITVVSVETLAEPNPGLGQKHIRVWWHNEGAFSND